MPRRMNEPHPDGKPVRAGVTYVSRALLTRLLDLPAGVRLLDVSDRDERRIRVVLIGPGLPEVPPTGGKMAEVQLVYEPDPTKPAGARLVRIHQSQDAEAVPPRPRTGRRPRTGPSGDAH